MCLPRSHRQAWWTVRVASAAHPISGHAVGVSAACSRRPNAPTPGRSASHIRIVRPAAALGRHPGDVLVRVLDVAGFAVDAVLRVDDEFGAAARC